MMLYINQINGFVFFFRKLLNIEFQTNFFELSEKCEINDKGANVRRFKGCRNLPKLDRH